MTTIREWFSDKPPDIFQFPKVSEDDYGLGNWVGVPTAPLPFNHPDLQIWLDYEFDAGYGTQGVPSFFAWTKNRVYYVWEYDGSTDLCYVPRHPQKRS